MAPNNWAIEGTIYYKDDFDAIANYGETDLVTATFSACNPRNPTGRAPTRSTSGWLRACTATKSMRSTRSPESNRSSASATWSSEIGRRSRRSTTFVAATPPSARTTCLLGPQVGAKVGLDGGLWGVEGIAKVGWFYNDAHTSTLIRDLNNTTTYRNVHRNGQNDACVFELGVMGVLPRR